MAWLLIHNTGEVQTIHMDKRQLIQVGNSSTLAVGNVMLLDAVLHSIQSSKTELWVLRASAGCLAGACCWLNQQ
jgi:hypothetical protein